MAMQPHGTEAPAPDLNDAQPNLRLFEIAWQRKGLLLLGLVLGVVLGVLYYSQAAPVYESRAQVLVVNKRPESVTGVDTRLVAMEDYVATHKELVRSPLIVGRAVKKHNLQDLPSLAGLKEDPVETIRASLTATRNRSASGNSNILDLAYRCKSREDAGKVLDAVIETYKDFLDETYRNMSDESLKLITQARNLQEGDLKKEEEQYREFRQNTPLMSKGQDGNHVSQDRLTGIEAKRATLLLRRADLQGELNALEKARKEGVDRATLLAMAANFGSKSDSDDSRHSLPAGMQDQLFPLLAEEQRLKELYGPEHPQVKSIRKRIEMARQFYSNPAAPYKQEADAAKKADAAPEDPVELHLQYLRQELRQVKASEELINEVYDKEQDDVRKLTRYEIEDEMHRNAVKRAQQLYDGIVKRLQDVDLAKDVGGYDAQVIAPPGLGKKVAPSGLVILPLAAFAGLLLGCGLVSLAEVTDKSFRTPEEVRRRLGLPVVGYIPYLTPAEEPVRKAAARPDLLPILLAYYRPRSREAEAYRGVRTALYFNTHGEGHKVLQVTSPNPDDGKSTLAANLAVSIAQSGKRTLLIDADLRKPEMHRAFGLPGDSGLVSLIAGEADPAEVIRPSAVPGLSVLPCGPVPPNPAELLTAPRFAELLALLREQYDFVLIDTPPLLAVTDPSVVAPRVDGVLLTIRLTKNGRPAAERAKEVLAALGATVLGVVINGADRGRGMDPYGYGYTYGHNGERYHGEDLPAQPAAGPSVQGPT
jgi:capsular exopolysaccharide synthesis family protein